MKKQIELSQALFLELEIIFDEIPLEKLAEYTAVEYFLTIEDTSPETASNLEKVRRYLEAFSHLVSVVDWKRAISILNLQLDTPSMESLHNQLGTWGYYREQIDLYNQLIMHSGSDILWLSFLGNTYYRLGNYQKAIDCHETSLSISNNIKTAAQYMELTISDSQYQDLPINSEIRAFAESPIDLDAVKRIERLAVEGLGIAYQSLNDFDRAIEYHQQSLAIAESINDARGLQQALLNLGSAYQYLANYETAAAYYQQSLSASRHIENRTGEFSALASLGNIFQATADYKSALIYYEQALEIAQEIEHLKGEFSILGNIGVVHQALGNYHQAIEHHRQHLKIAQATGDRPGEGIALGNLGNAYESLGLYDRATNYYRRRLLLAQTINNCAGEEAALIGLGNVCLNQGQLQQAIDFYMRALVIAKNIKDLMGEGMIVGNLGSAYHTLEEYEQAIGYSQQRLSIARQIQDRLGEAQTLKSLGASYYALQQFDRAIKCFQQGLAISRELGDRMGEGIALCNLGTILAHQSIEYAEALTYLQSSLEICSQIGDCCTQTYVFKALAELHLRLESHDLAIEFCNQSILMATELNIPIMDECRKLREEILSEQNFV
jgi:tetratricopeptide (TPR) repeat protein